jgi:hypothetical protein
MRMSGPRTGPIAFFLPTLPGGNAERVVMNLAQAMTDRGLPMDLVVARADALMPFTTEPAVDHYLRLIESS